MHNTKYVIIGHVKLNLKKWGYYTLQQRYRLSRDLEKEENAPFSANDINKELRAKWC